MLWLIDGLAPAFRMPLPVAIAVFVVLHDGGARGERHRRRTDGTRHPHQCRGGLDGHRLRPDLGRRLHGGARPRRRAAGKRHAARSRQHLLPDPRRRWSSASCTSSPARSGTTGSRSRSAGGSCWWRASRRSSATRPTTWSSPSPGGGVFVAGAVVTAIWVRRGERSIDGWRDDDRPRPRHPCPGAPADHRCARHARRGREHHVPAAAGAARR